MGEDTQIQCTAFEATFERVGVVLGVLIWLATEFLLYPASLYPVAGPLCTLAGAIAGYGMGYVPTTLPRRWRMRKKVNAQ